LIFIRETKHNCGAIYAAEAVKAQDFI